MNAQTAVRFRITLVGKDTEVIGLLDPQTGSTSRKLKKSEGPQTFRRERIKGIAWLVLMDGSAGNIERLLRKFEDDGHLSIDQEP